MAFMILRLPAVRSRTGLSRSTIYFGSRKASFLNPFLLGARAVGWVDAEVDAWVVDQIELSRRTQGERSRATEAR